MLQLVAGVVTLLAAGGDAQPGDAAVTAAACRLPATAVVEAERLRMPADIGTMAATVRIGADERGAWRRLVGNRATIAEIALEPKLAFGEAYALRVIVDRRPSRDELQSLRVWLAGQAATATPLTPIRLEDDAEAALRPACGRWDLPRLDSLPASQGTRDTARAVLARRRDSTLQMAGRLAAAIETLRRPEAGLTQLRAQAQDTAGGSAREIRLLDDLISADPADTAAARLVVLTRLLERANDMLATWHARRPRPVRQTTLDQARGTVTSLLSSARTLATLRQDVATGRVDSVATTARLAADLLTAHGEAGLVTETLAHDVMLPEPDAGRWRIGVGAHYTAPVRSPLLGYPGGTNRIYPDVFVHWSPPATGGRRPVTIDLGLALNTVGRHGATRDLFWRSSLLLGGSVHPRGFVRIGAGVQVIREVTSDDRNRLRIPLYVAVSVAQFKL